MKSLSKLLVLLAVCAFSVSARAMSLGFYGGYRQTNIVASPAPGVINFSAASGVQGGMLFIFSLSESFLLRTGGLYATRDLGYSALAGTATGKYKLAYVDIPIIFQANISSTGFYLTFGEKLGVKTSDTCEVSTPAGGTCTALNAAPMDITGVVGVGFELFPLGAAGKFAIEADYEYGLNWILQANNSNTNGLTANALIKFNL